MGVEPARSKKQRNQQSRGTHRVEVEVERAEGGGQGLGQARAAGVGDPVTGQRQALQLAQPAGPAGRATN